MGKVDEGREMSKRNRKREREKREEQMKGE